MFTLSRRQGLDESVKVIGGDETLWPILTALTSCEPGSQNKDLIKWLHPDLSSSLCKEHGRTDMDGVGGGMGCLHVAPLRHRDCVLPELRGREHL